MKDSNKLESIFKMIQICNENEISAKNFIKAGIVNNLFNLFQKEWAKQNMEMFSEMCYVLQDYISHDEKTKQLIGKKFLTKLVQTIENKTYNIQVRMSAAETLNPCIAYS